MTECLDEEAILSFCRGSMAAGGRPGVEAHIAECDECRTLVSAVVRSSLVEPKELVSDPAMAPTTPAQGLGSSSPSGPNSAPVRAGDVLAGKYAVEHVLGAGGMGVVVAARHTQLDQRVALKFLLPAACEAPGAIARFLREGKAAARITSEHVARVVDTGVLENGSPYLVMEYLEGSDLGALTAQRGPIHPAEAVEYVLQACEAIVEAHQLGIVHRDLKPANLFLARRKDGSPLVKVLDFGISKAEGGSQTQLTSTSMLMGSPRYMSPEQMVSAKDVDARTDIWALGVILYELVTGTPVWHADTVQGLCALIATAPTPPLRQLAPHAPPILEEVVFRCLAKAPAQRIASVADLVLALEPVAPEQAKVSIDRVLRVAGRTRGSIPVRSVAAPASMPPASGARPPSSSGRLIVLLAAVIGVLVVVGLVLNTALLRRGRASTSSAVDASAHLPSTSAAPPSPPPGSTTVAAPPAPAPTLPAAAATVATKPAPRTRPASAPPAEPPKTTTARAPDPPPPAPHPTSDAPNRALSDRK